MIGPLGGGFSVIMHNFNSERLMMAAQASMYARLCAEEAVSYARQRHTFGARLADHQVSCCVCERERVQCDVCVCVSVCARVCVCVCECLSGGGV